MSAPAIRELTQAVVPAAGAGTRLRPYTADQPKGLVDVAGKPLFSYSFGTLERLGVTEAVVVEKPDDPPSRTIPRGVSVCSPLLFSACKLVMPSHTGEYELSAAFGLVLDAGHEIETVPFEGWCRNVNTDRGRKRVAAHFTGRHCI